MNLSVTVDGGTAQNEQHRADNYVNGACKPSILWPHRKCYGCAQFKNAEHNFLVSEDCVGSWILQFSKTRNDNFHNHKTKFLFRECL